MFVHKMESENRNRQPSNNSKENKDNKSSASSFDCNICLETAKDAVVSRCGHLFCWPCLHQWLETRPDRQICPVCKAAVSRDTVVPLYSGGNENQQDPRDKVPPRPQAQREEADEERPQNFIPGFGAHGGFQMSFGLGAFPFFPVFGTTLTFGQPLHPAHHRMPENPNAAQVQQVFLAIAVFCIIYMLFFV